MSTASLTYPPARSSTTHLAGLVWTLIRTDFKTRYHGTIQGFLWALLKPLTMFLVLMGVFSFIFASEPAYRLNLIIGLFLWDFFVQSTTMGLISLHVKGYLLTKAKFPAWIIVVTSISNALITLVVFFVIILVALTVSGRAPAPWAVALFFWYLILFISIVIGFSLATSVWFLRYRDLNQVWDVTVHAGFFLAPIIYPLGIIPERYHFYFYLWPPTPVIEFSRSVLVSGVIPTPTAHMYLALDAVLSLVAGIIIFRRFAPRAAEFV